jgi:hypothetical protein
VISEGSRIPGFKGSSDPPKNRRIKMLKNYKELKVWQKSYELCLKIFGLRSDALHQKKDIAEIVRMLKSLIKSLKNKPLNP